MITTCTKCGQAYEAGSEEQANEPVRLCFTCRGPQSIEEAAQGAVRAAALEAAEVACLLHENLTVLHLTTDGCPVCRKPDPEAIIRAMHALATAPTPAHQVLAAVRAMEPFTRQLAEGKGITAMGHTVDDVIRLGAAQKALEAWLNQ